MKTVVDTLQLPALPGQANPAGTPYAAIEPAFKLEGPEFDPLTHLESSIVEKLRDYARQQVRRPDFDLDDLELLIQSFNVGETPGIDELLDNIQLRASGDLGRALRQVTNRMTRVNEEVPQLDQRWIKKIEEGRASVDELIDKARWIARAIQDAIAMYGSHLDEIRKQDDILAKHEDLMREGRMRNDTISKGESKRAQRLLQLCAALVLIQEAIAEYLEEINGQLATGPNELLKEEQSRLVGLGPILINALGSLAPLVLAAEMNSRQYLEQRNDNALTEFRLHMFRGPGLSQWKAFIGIKMNALMNEAANMELTIAQDFLNLIGQESSAAYLEQMGRYAKNFGNFMLRIETFRAQAEALVQAGQELEAGIKAADQKRTQVYRELEGGRLAVEQANQSWVKTIQAILAR
jgi:hypothetical protein